MANPPGIQPAPRRTPLTADKRARSEVAFTSLVAEHLTAGGPFRVSADTPEMAEPFQTVARRAGDLLQRPLVSYADGRYIVITFGQEAPHLTGQEARTVQR